MPPDPRKLKAGRLRLYNHLRLPSAAERPCTRPSPVRAITMSPTASNCPVTSLDSATFQRSWPPAVSPVSVFQASASVAVCLNSTSSAGLALDEPAPNQPPTVLHPVRASTSPATSRRILTWPLRPARRASVRRCCGRGGFPPVCRRQPDRPCAPRPACPAPAAHRP